MINRLSEHLKPKKLCERCGGKGYLETYYHFGSQVKPLIGQCCDIAAYSKRVLESLGKPFAGETKGGKCPVIPFKRK